MGIGFHLFDVLLLQLTHEVAAMEKVGAQVGSQFMGNGAELIVSGLAEGDGAAGGNEVSTPLINQAEIPNHEAGEHHGGDRDGEPAAREESSEVIKQHGEAKNENGSEGNKEAIAEGSDASPIRVNDDE